MFGPDALTGDHFAAFQEFNIKRILTPCESVCPRLLEAGLDCFLLRFPAGFDANSHARQAEDSGQTLGAILRNAEWIGKGAEATRPIIPPVRVEEPSPAPPMADKGPRDEFEDDHFEDELAEEEVEHEVGVPVEESAPVPEAPSPILTASPLPTAPKEVEAEVKDDEVVMNFGDRRYRVRGWQKNLSFDQLRINVMASNERGMFVDTFDIYAAKYRKAFIAQTAADLFVEENTIKKDLGRLLLKLEELQDNQIEALTTPKEITPATTDEERVAALEFLRDPCLLDRIVADFQVVGENTNKLMGYLAAVSRKLDQPLAIIIQSSSAAGKTALMEAVLSFVPPEDQVKYSAMTGQSLFYMERSESQTQDPGHRRRGRRRKGQLCPEALAQ